MQAREAPLQNFKAPLYHSSATFFSIIITNFWFWVQKRDHEVGSSCQGVPNRWKSMIGKAIDQSMPSAVTNNEAIDGSIAKLFSNWAIVKNALVMSSYESFTVTNSLNVFITARRRRHCSSKRTSKHNDIQWNPVNTKTKRDMFYFPFYPERDLRKKRHGYIFLGSDILTRNA